MPVDVISVRKEYTMKRIMFVLLVIALVAVAGCTRSAGVAPPPTKGDVPVSTAANLPFPTVDPNQPTQVDQGALATTLAGGFATATAQAKLEAEGAAAPSGDNGSGEVVAPAPSNTPLPTNTPVPAVTKPDPVATEKPAANDCSSPYTVKDDEWVYKIGRKCNIHPDDIIAANNLRWPYTLFPGDQIVLPKDARPFPPE